MTQRLMVLVDGSEHAEYAFEAALRWKKDDDQLYIVHAVELIRPWIAGGLNHATYIDPKVFKSANESLVERGKKLVHEFDKKCKEKNIHHIKSFVVGSDIEEPKDSALNFSHQEKINCIFVGTRGNGAFKRFFLGSFSHYIVNNAECDVMIIKEFERRKKIKEQHETAAIVEKEKEKLKDKDHHDKDHHDKDKDKDKEVEKKENEEPVKVDMIQKMEREPIVSP